MKFLAAYLPVVPFIVLPLNGMSATATLTQRNRRTLAASNQGNLFQQHHHFSLPRSTKIGTWNFVPFLSQRGGNRDTTINVDMSSSSQPLNAPMFDMERMKIRLDGLSQYAVISALLLNICMNIYFNTMKYLEHDVSTVQSKARQNKSTFSSRFLSRFSNQGMKVAKVMFILSSIFSIISSAYTVVVFTLLGLYSKSALGMGCDMNFLLFFDTTQKWRESAFDAFVMSLMNFEISFLSSLIIAYKGQYRLLIIALTALCLSYSFYHWVSIITIAGRLLYSTASPVTPGSQ
jgi:hypothetical protein